MGGVRNEKKPVEVYWESCVKATSADLMREIGTPNVPGCRWFLGDCRVCFCNGTFFGFVCADGLSYRGFCLPTRH